MESKLVKLGSSWQKERSDQLESNSLEKSNPKLPLGEGIMG